MIHQPPYIAKKFSDYYYNVRKGATQASGDPMIDRKTAQKYANALNNDERQTPNPNEVHQ